MYPEQNPKL